MPAHHPNNPWVAILRASPRRIFDQVVDAMQEAEEIGGPAGGNYVNLMEAIIAEAKLRIDTYLANLRADLERKS